MKTTNKNVALSAVVMAIIFIAGTAVAVDNLGLTAVEGVSPTTGEVQVYVTEAPGPMATTGEVSVYVINPEETG